MEIVKKHNSGHVWKRFKLTSTRKANSKKCLHCVWQVILSILCFISSIFSNYFPFWVFNIFHKNW
ncbi:hypothetical protein Gotur_026307, partial [Gossypium turneri]